MLGKHSLFARAHPPAPSRRSRSRTLGLRRVVVVVVVAFGCSERERPAPIADPRGDDGERAVSGSFRAPGSGGGASTARDAGSTDAGASSAGIGGAASTESGPLTLQQTYRGTCEGASVQWGFFTFDAATPSDSSVLFRLRTAAAEAELARASFVDLLTASAALGTERCAFTGPAPCPIDLYEVLDGAPLAHHPFAQLQVLLRPASDDGRMPAVQEWQLTYSCTFNQ
jgi:hypothetical protein